MMKFECKMTVVELSFMPSFLAGCSWSVTGVNCHDEMGLPCNTSFGAKKCAAGMAYQGVRQLPLDWDDWRHLVQASVEMAVETFGLPEVQRWRFEVWNELWGMAGDLPGKKAPACTKPPCVGSVYMALYNASAVGVKAVDESLKVGGPATEHLNTQNFMSQAKEMGAPVDFVSTHNYPTGPRGDGSGCPQGADWEPDCFTEHVMATRGEIPADTPLMITEYSVMVGEGMAADDALEAGAGRIEPPFQHDGPGAAAFVMRVVPQLSPHLEALSYWTFSDIFEENEIPRTEFHPVGLSYPQPHYGLMSLHGVPKPGWRGFQMLHMHAGSHMVPAVVTHGPGQMTGGNGSMIAATATVNATAGEAAEGSGRVFLSHWDGTHDAWSHSTGVVSLEVTGGNDASGSETAQVYMIDNTTSANLLWQSWGSPPVPTAKQIDELKNYSEIKPHLLPYTTMASEAGAATKKVVTVVMPPNTAAVVVV